jgi:hypothetical protein
VECQLNAGRAACKKLAILFFYQIIAYKHIKMFSAINDKNQNTEKMKHHELKIPFFYSFFYLGQQFASALYPFF